MMKIPTLMITLPLAATALLAEEVKSTSDAGRWSKQKMRSHRPAVVTPPGFSADDKAGKENHETRQALVFRPQSPSNRWTDSQAGIDQCEE